MPSDCNTCVIVLSTKSSGSSAVQQLLSLGGGLKHVRQTRHEEYETLYWTKAASALGLAQTRMVDSEVPLSAKRAERELRVFLKRNAPSFAQPSDIQRLVCGGWEALCSTFGPVFLEKSPHHLVQWPSIQLMLECEERLDSTRFYFVGLVRNPMDVLYSAWSRWRSPPELVQYEWLTAYQNLHRLAALRGERLCVVRYEDLVTKPESVGSLMRFVGLSDDLIPETSVQLHRRSISKWRQDSGYGFQLAEPVRKLAEQFGYAAHDLDNPAAPHWDRQRRVLRVRYKIAQALLLPRRLLRRLRVLAVQGL